MFNKPFRVKSSTLLKTSEKKKLRSDVLKKFPLLEEEVVSKIVPVKEEIKVSKVCTHSGLHVLVYFVQKNPIFFQVYEFLYPTIYTLWSYPKMLPIFYTWPNVLPKMAGGADLMLPGVVVDTENYGPNSFGHLYKNDLCAICLVGNDSPVAVGSCAMSSQDMFDCGKRGKGILIKHLYTDQLWASGESSSPPDLGSNFMRNANNDHELSENKDKAVNEVENLSLGQPENGDDEPIAETNEDFAPEFVDERSSVEIMDELLLNSFLCSWKTSAKNIELPVLTSNFFRCHMAANSPLGQNLDVKKSSYKKLTKFLKVMEKEGMITIKELTKGVESIVSVNVEHPSIRTFRIPKKVPQSLEVVATQPAQQRSYVPPDIKELHYVTAQVLPIFQKYGFRKGSYFDKSEVRKVICDYVKDNELQDPGNKRFVKLDPHLTDCVLNKDEYQTTSKLQWEDLTSRMLNKMQIGYMLKFEGQPPITKKGKLDPIDISLAQRSGNKKVTLVHNLHIYGIDPTDLAHKVQIGVAASTSVNPSPANIKSGPQVLIQGNQVKYLEKLLMGEYQLPRRFLKGLELAKKK